MVGRGGLIKIGFLGQRLRGMPLEYKRIKTKANSFVTVFSTDDPWVGYEANRREVEKLGGNIIVKEGMGHFITEHGVKELPFLIELL